jgi:hypothetical protein
MPVSRVTTAMLTRTATPDVTRSVAVLKKLTETASGFIVQRLRVGDRDVLIAECKIWDEAKSISDALGQLFRYMDNSAARTVLITFFRTNDPEPRIARAVDAIKNHPNHESTDRTRAEEHRQWSFRTRGNRNPGTATRATVAFIPSSSPDPKSQGNNTQNTEACSGHHHAESLRQAQLTM